MGKAELLTNNLLEFMKNILKIFYIIGILCMISCSGTNIQPQLMNRQECKYISIRDYFNRHRYITRNDSLLNELFEILQSAKYYDVIKMPPRLVITIKGIKSDQTFFVCDNCIKDKGRRIYKCNKDIEKELYRIMKEN